MNAFLFGAAVVAGAVITYLLYQYHLKTSRSQFEDAVKAKVQEAGQAVADKAADEVKKL